MKQISMIVALCMILPACMIGCAKTTSEKQPGSQQEETKVESNKKLKIEGVGDDFKIEGMGKDFKIEGVGKDFKIDKAE